MEDKGTSKATSWTTRVIAALHKADGAAAVEGLEVRGRITPIGFLGKGSVKPLIGDHHYGDFGIQLCT